jgi:hypothetical protein
MRSELNDVVKDTAMPTQEEVEEFKKFEKNFPKPYTKAEGRMLAFDDEHGDVSSDSDDDSSESDG